MQQERLTTVYRPDDLYRILALDGGSAKAFYSLGVLKEIKAMLNCRLYQRLDLIFGTSTGELSQECIYAAQSCGFLNSLQLTTRTGLSG